MQARIVAKPDGKSRIKWDADDQVAARLREIRHLCDQAQDALEWGALAEASRKLGGIKYLANEALNLRARKMKGAA